MSPSTSEESIFYAAIQLSDAEARSDYISRACGSDKQLTQRVECLVSAYSEGEFLESPIADVTATALLPTVGEQPGDTIGPYKLLEQIGEGGMGLVFMAEQMKPLRRRVALKIIKPGLDTRAVISRFEAERQALAMMDHPNIARVLDGGKTASGRPYFVMELVRGMPITAYCDRERSPLTRRLELFIDVCHAVQHAHLKGIIHRDLKPTNVLVTECDGKSLVKVIDFGIAKAIGQEQLTEKTLFTSITQLVGTPAYMSPEQAALSAVDVDTRSDVYSLGVLLYELLTGGPPLEFDALREAGYDGMRRMIQDVSPQRPSARISTLKPDTLTTLADNRQIAPDMIRRQLRGDLDWIVMKALEKDRARRYQSVTGFIEDIQAFLCNDPVTARPPTKTYLLAKFARKHRLALGTSGLMILTLLGGMSASLWQANRAFRAQRMADISLIKEQQARAEVVSRAASLQRELYAGDMADAWQAWNDGEIDRARTYLNRYQPTPGQNDLREFTWHFLRIHCDYVPTVLGSHQAAILTATLAPNGRLLASGDRDGTIAIWDIESQKQVATWKYSDQEVTTAAFSPNCRVLATAGQDSTIRLWNVDDWSELACLRGHSKTICSLSWSPDGDRLASGGRDNSVRIWNVASQHEDSRSPDMGDVVRCVVWLPDQVRVAAAVGKAVRLWRIENWIPVGEPIVHDQGVLSLAVSPDGRLLASSGYGADVLVSSVDTGEVAMRSNAMTTVWSLAFSPDGRYLLGGLGSGGPSVWRVSEHRLELIRLGVERSEKQRAALLDSTGRTIVTVSEEDREIQLWDTSEILGHTFISFPEDCLAVAVEKDWAICAAPDGTVHIRQLSGGQAIGELRGHRARAVTAALSQSSRWMATTDIDGQVLLWDLNSFRLHQRLSFVRSPGVDQTSLTFSPDEKLLAAGNNTASIRIWHVADGRLLRDRHGVGTARLAFAPNNEVFVTSVDGLGGKLWHTQSGAEIASFGAGLTLWDFGFAADGSQLYAAAGADGAIGWEIPTWRERFRLSRHHGSTGQVAVSPDGQTLATLGTDNSIRLWHLPTGRALFTILQHSQRLNWLQFASPTKLLVGASLQEGTPVGIFVFDADNQTTVERPF